MASIGPAQRVVVRPRYDHMSESDTEVWTRFLLSGEFELTEVWYDVHVGSALGLPPGMAGAEAARMASIGQKRIDAVCRVNGLLWVVEIKPYANYVALGQILAYRWLFWRDYVEEGEAIGVVVCDAYDTDLGSEFRSNGVTVIVPNERPGAGG